MATSVIPIDFRNPRITSLGGNCFWTVLGLTDHDLGLWEFVKDVDGKLYGTVKVPAAIAGSPNAKIKIVVIANATSGVTRLNVANKCVADDAESLNPASLVDDTAQDITVPGTAYLGKKVTFTAGDLSNIAAADIILVEVFHEGAHANDTLAVSTLLVEGWLEVDVT